MRTVSNLLSSTDFVDCLDQLIFNSLEGMTHEAGWLRGTEEGFQGCERDNSHSRLAQVVEGISYSGLAQVIEPGTYYVALSFSDQKGRTLTFHLSEDEFKALKSDVLGIWD